MELSFQKRIRSSVDVGSGRDRLSEMPDEVIVHILSYMPIVDAVRTVVLRRFGNLWTLVPTLKLYMAAIFDQFDFRYYSDDSYDYEYDDVDDERGYIFIRNVLIFHKNPVIDKFHLSVEFRDCSKRTKVDNDDIKIWLRFALDRQAKEIELRHDRFLETRSLVPNFTSQSLFTLTLNYCKIETRLLVNLPSLKKLVLDYCSMSNEGLRKFISGCASLRELVVKNPADMDKLSFSAPNVDKLSLVLAFNLKGRKLLALDCPNLKTLDLDIFVPINIVDVSSVRDIYVKNYLNEFNHLNEFYEQDMPQLLRSFYGKFNRAEVIHLSCDVSWHFLDTMQHLDLLKHRWKRVVLKLSRFCQVCLVGIDHLMRRCVNLEELAIHTTQGFKVETNMLPSEVSSTCLKPQLKTITLHGYAKSWKSQLQLVEFLLKGAAVLEKLVIFTIDHRMEASEELEFVNRVSSFPKASTRFPSLVYKNSTTITLFYCVDK